MYSEGQQAPGATFKKGSDEVHAVQLLKASCLECHGQGEDTVLPLGDLKKMKSYRSFLDESVADLIASGEMPRNRKLSEADKRLLLKFLR